MKFLKSKSILFIGMLLFLTMLLGILGLHMPANKAAAMSERVKKITELTTEEQTQVEAQLLKDWGNPTKMTALKDGFTATDIQGGGYFYLTQDVTANCTASISNATYILLNGYTIFGTFNLTNTALLNVFDKISNQQGVEYTYNPNPVKYFSYDTNAKAYSTYSTSKFSGMQNVTAMPNFKANTYIKISGSSISGKNAYITVQSTANFYAINFVGIYSENAILYSRSGALNLYQCNMLGNSSQIAIWNVDSIINSIGCNIYGNRYNTTKAELVYLVDSATAYYDIFNENGKSFIINKSNIGVVACKEANNKHYQSFKDVNFGKKYDIETFDFYNDIDGAEGTIELIYNANIHYVANAPKLNFILHGIDDRTSYTDKNTLTLDKNAVVNTAVVSGTGYIYPTSTVNTINHDGNNGAFINGHETPAVTIGSAGNAQSQVTVMNQATLMTLDIRAGEYTSSGVLQAPSLPSYDENDYLGRGGIPNIDNGGNTTNGGGNVVVPSAASHKVEDIITIVSFSLAGVILLIVLILLLILYIKRRREKKIEKRYMEKLAQQNQVIDKE